MRFIHMADVHLGAVPDAGFSWSEERRRDIWDTFRNCIDDCSRRQVDLLLIAGDLFHRQPSPQQLREVNYLFSTIPDTRIVLMAGNHDFITPSSPYLTFPFSPNVSGLFSDQIECLRFPEIHTDVYGCSYSRQEIREPLYDDVEPLNSRNFKILLAHGGDDRHIPIRPDRLARSGFDYVALGHIHRPDILLKNKAAYSGAPEPTDAGDTGRHGYILGEVKNGHLSIRFVPKAKREYHRAQIMCSEADTTYSLRDKITACIRKNGDKDIYHFTLTGNHRPGIRFDTARLMECGRIVDIEDQTGMAFHPEQLRREYEGQLIGRYIESFDGQDRGEVQKKALQYGLEALLATRKDNPEQ